MDPRIATALSARAGLVSRRDLLRAGLTQNEIDRAWRDRVVLRVRHGLYADPGLPAPVLRAARVGGALAGPSAVGLTGAWQPHGAPLFVSARANDHRLRDPDDAGRRLRPGDPGVVVLRDRDHLDSDAERAVVSTVTAVVQTIRLLPVWEAIAVLDSVQHAGALTSPAELAALASRLPARLRPVIDLADRRAEAGTESITRVRLLDAGIPTMVQPTVAPGLRCDLLVGDRLVVECVSVEHHAGSAKFNADRRRIGRLVQLGYTAVELPYPDIPFDWGGALATVESAMWTVGVAQGEQPVLRCLR
jgi:hypothetical protein